MIVTRHRKRRASAGRFIIPLLILAALGGALAWPPSHHVIADGPLKPAWTVAGNTGAVMARPLTFAAQQQSIADRNRQIRDLNGRLEEQRAAKATADTRVAQLQQQVASLANQPPETPAPAPRPVATLATGLGAGLGSASAAAPATAEEKRLAATWAAMEPDKAAAVVQRLPDDEVTRILGSMDTDSAGAIMEALPPAVAARISRATAQVQPAAGR